MQALSNSTRLTLQARSRSCCSASTATCALLLALSSRFARSAACLSRCLALALRWAGWAMPAAAASCEWVGAASKGGILKLNVSLLSRSLAATVEPAR